MDENDDFTPNPEDSLPDPTPPTPDGTPSEYWDSDEALSSLKMERDVHGESNEELTKRLLAEAAPAAASAIIHVAMHSQNDNTRLSAAKYIIDWNSEDGSGTGKQSWEELIGDVVSQAEVHANSGESDPNQS